MKCFNKRKGTENKFRTFLKIFRENEDQYLIRTCTSAVNEADIFEIICRNKPAGAESDNRFDALFVHVLKDNVLTDTFNHFFNFFSGHHFPEHDVFHTLNLEVIKTLAVHLDILSLVNDITKAAVGIQSIFLRFFYT